MKLKFSKSKSKWRNVIRRIVLILIGFIIGLICSFLFYEFVVSELDFSPAYEIFMFGMVGVFLPIGFGFSSQIRCLMCLTLPEFFSKAGKRSVQAAIMILVLAGPIENIGRNGEEVVRLMSCFKDLTINMTIVGRDLLLAPVQHIIYGLKTEENDEKFNLTELSDLIAPVAHEIEDQRLIGDLKDENDFVDQEMGHGKRSQELEIHYRSKPEDNEAQHVQKNYEKKMAYICEGIFTRGTEACKKIFDDKYEACYEKVTVYLGWLLCWPMKLTFVCDLIGMFAQSELCDMSQVVAADLGEKYVYVKDELKDLTKKFEVKVDYQGLAKYVNIDKLNLDTEDMIAAFERTRGYIQYFMTLVRRTLALTFLFMLLDALTYHGKYFKRLSFDNCYITSYFSEIDSRRRAGGKVSIFPLRNFEKSDFMILWKCRLSDEERYHFLAQLFVTFMYGLIIFTIYAFDYAFRRLLELVRDHADITIQQTGVHKFTFEIQGVGFIARLLRNIVKDLSFHKDVHIEHFTKPCLPNPWILDQSYYRRTIILFLLLLFICYAETFCTRFRHCIANYFYPKRSKARILWLYNQTMRKRYGKLVQLKERVLRNADEFRENVDISPITALVEVFPRACACLRICKSGQRKCLVCKQQGEVFRCPICYFSYCQECYEDVGERCLYCIARQELQTQMYEEYQREEDQYV